MAEISPEMQQELETHIEKMNDMIEGGDFDQALEIARVHILPMFEKAGDDRSYILTLSLIADIHDLQGNLQESIRLRTEEIHPVLLQHGDLQNLCTSSRKLAMAFLKRDNEGDRDTAKELLQKSLQLAAKLQIPEAQIILNVMLQSGLETEDSLKALLETMGFRLGKEGEEAEEPPEESTN